MTVGYLIGLIGLIGFTFGLICAMKLRQWERQLVHARIAVAYKRKVQLQAPLNEWLAWANLLDRDERSNGRVVYRNGGVTVAILKPQPQHGKTKTHTVKT